MVLVALQLGSPFSSVRAPPLLLRQYVFIERGAVAGNTPLCCLKKRRGYSSFAGLLPGLLLRPPGFFAAEFLPKPVVPAGPAGKGSICTSLGPRPHPK